MLSLMNTKLKLKLSKHCLGTLTFPIEKRKLTDAEACRTFVNKILSDNNVISLGELMHIFPNHSFSLLFNLAESHISIHTWPEKQTVQLDVFLCNYLKDNTEICENIYDQIVDYFKPEKITTTVIRRR
jgi:S-adenosylmethionine decarboxylase